MNRILFAAAAALSLFVTTGFAQEKFPVWPGLAPGEKGDYPAPTFTVFKPEKKTTDACVIVCPGGGYQKLVPYVRDKIVNLFVEKGVTTVLLEYRVPRREGVEIYRAAWQDAQRTIKHVRRNAPQWGVDPEKIGMIGFSAGGHLTVLCAVNSQTPAYEPVDELDSVPCHINFAIPVYPAYVLEDGEKGPNANRGIDSPILKDFKFDDKSAPMCLLHGDNDVYSPLGSVAIYTQMKKKGVPMEMHIYGKTRHSFASNTKGSHSGGWFDRCYEWMKVMGYSGE
ncbi:MAG: alpha/beta hydrolase [Thermoguttaceae bacterium]|nr:alpha/beta hydrolase [Thermoguttaceae bacterium]